MIIKKGPIVPEVQDLTVECFANFMVATTSLLIESKAIYADMIQGCLTILCEDLAEHVDVHSCLEIMHNVFMYVGTHDEKYRKLIKVVIDDIKRKEKKPNE